MKIDMLRIFSLLTIFLSLRDAHAAQDVFHLLLHRHQASNMLYKWDPELFSWIDNADIV
jgi:hypothetical protein